MASDYGSFATSREHQPGFSGPPKQLQLGVPPAAVQRMSSYGTETFLPSTSMFGGNSPEPTMTMASSVSGANYAFNPAYQTGYVQQQPNEYESRAGTMMDSHGTMLGESQ